MSLLDDAMLDELTIIFQDVFQHDDLILTRGTTREQVPEWDSMNHLNLVMALEMRYRIKFSLSEIETAQSVADILATIERKTLA